MRSVSLIACVSLLTSGFLLSTGPTLAADCTKGMLWPYVRAAGDCLTDAEIAAGQKGAYSGPTDTNVDVSAIKPPAAPAQAGSPAAAGGVVRSDGALIETSIFGAEPPARAVAQCHKGVIWPFNREPGDCLTEGEKQSGQTGVYGGAAAVTPASASATVPTTAAPSAEGAAPMPQTASCSKSWLWPFVKVAGDCLSAGEKQSGQSGTAAMTQASVTTTVPAGVPAVGGSATQPPQQAPVPQAASCSKGLFWPFVREGGDCPSEADKNNSGQK